MLSLKLLQRRTQTCQRRALFFLVSLVCVLVIIDSSTRIYLTTVFAHESQTTDVKNIRISTNSTDVTTVGRHGEFNASYIFREVTGAKMYSFYNVCIEERKPPVTERGWGCRAPSITQKVVIYRGLPGHQTVTFEQRNISVAGSFRTEYNNWQLFFTNASIPSSHTLLPTTAFFVTETFTDNLFHVWDDLFAQLYSVVRYTNRLHPGMQNQILYRNPTPSVNLGDPACKSCWRSTFDTFQDTLHTTKKYYLFHDLPTNTCYSSAVFGTRNMGTTIREPVDYVIKELKLSYRPQSRKKNVVIIKRRYRRILNIDDLAKKAKRIGFNNVAVEDMASMTVREQMRMIIDTDILIGVQGAGLQWGIFMRPGSTVIEIIWSKKYWRSHFSFLRNYGIKLITFDTNEVFANWDSYARFFRNVSSPEERTRMLNSPPKSILYDNLWKFADIKVNVEQFQTLLKTLL